MLAWLNRQSTTRGRDFGVADELVVPYQASLLLTVSQEGVQPVYRSLFERSVPEEGVRAIRETLEASYPLGSTRFKKLIELALGSNLGKLKRGGES
jgi:hypothetical protein